MTPEQFDREKAYQKGYPRNHLTNKYEIMENREMIKQVLTDTADLNSEAEKLQDEIVMVTELIRQCVEENARSIIDQAEYQQR